MQHKPLLFVTTSFIAMLYILLNIYISQKVAPEFSGIVYKNDRTAAVSFLQKIAARREFSDQLALFSTVYGKEIFNDVMSPTTKVNKQIAYYTSLLKKNAKSRDVLFKLALLYKNENSAKSREYYKKALAIDPNLPSL